MIGEAESTPTRSDRVLEPLDQEACLSLMATEVVGRLGTIDGLEPLIFPVNYVLDGLTVVFRTAPGTKRRARWRTPVCFEVDSLDRARHLGWSVVAKGALEEVDQQDGSLFESVRRLPVEPWASGAKDHWMRLLIREVSGRRLVRPRGGGRLGRYQPPDSSSIRVR